ELLRGRLGEAANGELRGRIRAEDGEPLDRRDGCRGDDLSTVTELFELRCGRLDAPDHAVDVDPEDLIELFGGDLEYGLDLGDAGVVDDPIEPAELFGGCVDSGNDLVALRHVRSDEDRFSAQLLDLGDDRITLLALRLDVRDGD